MADPLKDTGTKQNFAQGNYRIYNHSIEKNKAQQKFELKNLENHSDTNILLHLFQSKI